MRGNDFPKSKYRGLLAIGDPHLEGRVPGFRKDDYPRAVLAKLRWCLRYAAGEHLLPMILGDLFQLPRNNPNWLLVELLEAFDQLVIGIYGNHDIHENSLADDDSISILVKAGRLRLLDDEHPYRALINGRRVVVGGTPWGRRIPGSFADGELFADDEPLVVWLTHHDVASPGLEGQACLEPRPLPGIDLVINGHIHRRAEPVRAGHTHWFTPGNIARRTRSDATREHVPSALRIDIAPDAWNATSVEVPHEPFESVFHTVVIDPEPEAPEASGFVTGLAELQARKTETGEGLVAFLERNLDQFEPDVAEEIRNLAREVTGGSR